LHTRQVSVMGKEGADLAVDVISVVVEVEDGEEDVLLQEPLCPPLDADADSVTSASAL